MWRRRPDGSPVSGDALPESTAAGAKDRTLSPQAEMRALNSVDSRTRALSSVDSSLPGSLPSSLPEPRGSARSFSPGSPSGSASPMEAAVDLVAARAQRRRLARERKEGSRSPSPTTTAEHRRRSSGMTFRNSVSAAEVEDVLAAALSDEKPVKPKSRLTFPDLAGPVLAAVRWVRSWDARHQLRRCSRCLDGCLRSAWVWCAGLPARVDERVYDWQNSRLQRRVQVELVRMAVEAGELPPEAVPGCCRRSKLSAQEAERLHFAPEQVVEAFQRMRPQPRRTFLHEAWDGEFTWQTVWKLEAFFVLGILLLLVLHLCIALLVFSPTGIAVTPSGALVDSTFGGSTVSAGMTMRLEHLWEYPSLSLDELRKVEDIMFVHNQVTHMLRVVVITRTRAGFVLLKAADGSTVRVEPGGRTYWRRLGHPEELLEAMETWRTSQQHSSEIEWLTSGVLATQVTLPA